LLLRGSPYSPRFAAPHAQRSELKASSNNALLGDNLVVVRMRADPEPVDAVIDWHAKRPVV
jgi:hypothetical protein